MCSIKICEVGDLPPLDIEKVEIGELETFIILEAGTAKGKTSVAFHIQVDGKEILVQTSAALFNMMYSALQGAELRFEDKKLNDDTRTDNK